MSWKQKIAVGAAAAGLAIGGVTATAAPASAIGGCPSAKMCVYQGADFYNLHWTSASTQACPSVYGYNIGSYVNNLSVNVVVWGWDWNFFHYYVIGTIRPGGTSSDTLGNFRDAAALCTGGVIPKA